MNYDLKKYVPRAPSQYDRKLGRTFTILDFFLRDSSSYPASSKGILTAANISLLRQFLLDLFFLTYFWDPEEVSDPEVIVVGSGNGKYYPFLSDLFPTAVFHLYDGVEFVIEETDRIFLHNETFDPSVYDSSVYLISHIKSDDRSLDMKLQEQWISGPNRLTIIKSMIRFDVNHVNYYDGYALIAPWDINSYELYLIPTNNFDRRMWDLKTLRKKLWYHYHIVREHHNYLNIFTEDWQPYNDEYLINTRWDDTWTIMILRDYIVKMVHHASAEDVNDLLMVCFDELELTIGDYKTI